MIEPIKPNKTKKLLRHWKFISNQSKKVLTRKFQSESVE